MKISLKELRESLVWLKILSRKQMGDAATVAASTTECNELIAIFVTSTKTADQRSLMNLNQKSNINYQKSTIVNHKSKKSPTRQSMNPQKESLSPHAPGADAALHMNSMYDL